MIVHRVREKKRPQYSKHNFDKFSQQFCNFWHESSWYFSVLTYYKIYPNTSKPLRGDDVIYDVIKNAVYRQRRTFNKSFSKGKAWHCKSIAERRCKQKLELSLIKSLSKKLIKSVVFHSRHCPTWSCRRCSVHWCRAVVLSQHALRTALHIVKIDFGLN